MSTRHLLTIAPIIGLNLNQNNFTNAMTELGAMEELTRMSLQERVNLHAQESHWAKPDKSFKGNFDVCKGTYFFICGYVNNDGIRRHLSVVV